MEKVYIWYFYYLCAEHVDLAKEPAHASLLAEMIALFNTEVNDTYWQHTQAESYDDCNYGSNCPAQAAMEKYGGYCAFATPWVM